MKIKFKKIFYQINLEKNKSEGLMPGFYALLICVLLLAFNNCSEVEFEEIPPINTSSVSGLQTGIGFNDVIDENQQPVNVAPDHKEVVQEVVNNCNNLPVQSLNTQVIFEPQSQSCQWGPESTPGDNDPEIEANGIGNFGKRERYFQARFEQNQTLSMPAGSIICDMGFQSLETNMKYDDHILFSMNEVLLMSTYKRFVAPYTADEVNYVFALDSFGANNYDITQEAGYFDKQNGFFIYDWSKIRGEFWFAGNSWIDPGYCLGSDLFDDAGMPLSKCTWPETETLGSIQLGINPLLIKSIMALDPTRFEHEFKLTITGDNDASDCQHDSAIVFDLDIKYVVPEAIP